MRTVRQGPLLGLVANLTLIIALTGTVGLGVAAWVVGLTCGVVTNVALARGLRGAAAGPADRVTLIRATLVAGVAVLTVESFTRHVPVPLYVTLTTVALVLDAVDGLVARRTGTATPLGARFDMEVDAFLILVLSVYVSRSIGAWVLLIGAARYLYVAAGRALPWLRGTPPPRYWCKVVAAIQGIVLAFVAAGFAPYAWNVGLLLVALALLTESFGHDVWWLRKHRESAAPAPWVGRAVTVLAAVLVWAALVVPNQIGQLTPGALLRVPVEGLVLVAVVLILPARVGRVVALVVGVALGLLTFVKILDIGFYEALDRPFNPVTDWGYFGPAFGVLSDSIGRVGATVATALLVVLVGGVLALTALATRRVATLASRYGATSLRTVEVLGVVWILGVMAGAPVASSSAARLAFAQVGTIREGLLDERAFGQAVNNDPYRYSLANSLLTGLRGKDVLIVFVESYGRVAVQDSSFSGGVDNVLTSGTATLRAAGYDSRSAFLTSPTFGGISWLAHSTLQSGLWIDSQQRYDQLVRSDRFTLSDAFNRAGFRTLADIPSNEKDWPEGKTFYHYDTIYDGHNVGYHGPSFSYAAMPDQYTMSAFQRLELRPGHPPLMAEIDLVSSHTPWAPLPAMVPWDSVGDGTVFADQPKRGLTPDQVWGDTGKVRTAYGRSIQYSLNTLIDFVTRSHDDNLVMVMLGDHQPATIVTGEGATHDVPISIVAHDPAVFDQIASWNWQPGLLPSPTAPVWPMNTFRDRFLTAYGPEPR